MIIIYIRPLEKIVWNKKSEIPLNTYVQLTLEGTYRKDRRVTALIL